MQIYREKKIIRRKSRKFSEKKNKQISYKQMQNFSEKVAKIHQKRLNFKNKRFIFKEGFNREPN